MLEFIQTIFLSPIFILVVLIGVFLVISFWAIGRLQEYPGYALGWLIGVFFMIVYSSLVQQPPDQIQAQDVVLGGVTLNVFQVICPSIFGFALGIVMMFLINQNDSSAARRSLKVATLTALWLIIMFILIISDLVTQRMIGLLALAFGIGVMFLLVVFRRSSGSSDGAMMGDTQSAQDLTVAEQKLNSIRSRMQDRRERRG